MIAILQMTLGDLATVPYWGFSAKKSPLFVFKKSYNQNLSTGKLANIVLHFALLEIGFLKNFKQNNFLAGIFTSITFKK